MDVMHKITYMQLLSKTVVLVLRVQINKKACSYVFTSSTVTLKNVILKVVNIKSNRKISQLKTSNLVNTATSRKVVGKKVHATIPKGNMGYDQYTVPDTVAVEPTFVAFLQHSQTYVRGLLCHSFKFL